MTSSRPELSVVVLCYRSGESVRGFVQKMEQELRDEGIERYELVLVGNYFPGQEDPTPEVVRSMAKSNPHIVPVTLEKKGMMGWDVISGFQRTRGEAIALIDGDGQMPSKDVVRLWRVWKSGEFEFLKTLRIKRHDSFRRIVVSVAYNIIFRMVFPGIPFRDMNAKPKLLSRRALDQMKLECGGWFLDGEIVLEARRLRLSFAEIPTVFFENEWRASFVKPWSALEVFASMIRYRFKYWFGRT